MESTTILVLILVLFCSLYSMCHTSNFTAVSFSFNWIVSRMPCQTGRKKLGHLFRARRSNEMRRAWEMKCRKQLQMQIDNFCMQNIVNCPKKCIQWKREIRMGGRRSCYVYWIWMNERWYWVGYSEGGSSGLEDISKFKRTKTTDTTTKKFFAYYNDAICIGRARIVLWIRPMYTNMQTMYTLHVRKKREGKTLGIL